VNVNPHVYGPPDPPICSACHAEVCECRCPECGHGIDDCACCDVCGESPCCCADIDRRIDEARIS